MEKVITNAEIQVSLSKKIREIDGGTGDTKETKTLIAGVRAILGSVKLDIAGADRLGGKLFERTKVFLGAVE